jgi:cathepsin L
MSWNLSTLRKLAFAVVSICLVLPAAAQQTEPEEEVAAAPAEDPSEAEQQAFYAERLRTAPPEVKEVLSKLDSQRTANMTFRMGYTTALDRNLQELTGAKKGPPPGDLKAKMQRADKAMEVYRQLRSAERLPAPGASCNPTAKTFSWRKLNKVTPVKDQGVCGSCWAFSSAAAYESSNAILNNKLVDASEQDLMDCSEGTNCIGNWVQNAFARLITAGTTTERKRPYAGQVQQCAANLDRPYRAVVWAPLDAEWSRVMTLAEIKSNLCEYGPLVAHIYATPSFLAYVSGVYTQFEPVTHESEGYHAIIITGWDENQQAWEIKNSWGTGWGLGGFGRVKYGANLIGHQLLAVVATQDALSREAISSLREAASPEAASAVPSSGAPGADQPDPGN